MAQPETILERTDSMLGAMAHTMPENDIEKGRSRDVASLWSSGLSGSPMFSVNEPLDAAAEREAQNIITRFIARQRQLPSLIAMSHMVEFQQALQLRSKVLSAVEMLLRG